MDLVKILNLSLPQVEKLLDTAMSSSKFDLLTVIRKHYFDI